MPDATHAVLSAGPFDTSQDVRRVAMVSVHTSPLATLGGKDAGGMNVYIRDLALHLGRRGLAVDIFTRRVSPSAPETLHLAEGVRVVHVDAGPPQVVDKGQLFPLLTEFAQSAVRFGLREGARYDVVHAHYWLSGWVAHLLRRYWSTPFALMFHTTARMKNIVSPVELHETLEREQTEYTLLGLADSVIAANPDERDDLIQLLPHADPKVCTVPPGVDLTLFTATDYEDSRRQLDWASDERVVLFVGRIDPIKGLDVLVEALSLVTHPRRRFVFIGGDLDETGQPIGPLAEVAAAAERRGIADRSVFLGAQPQDRLPLYYSAADIVAVPSRYESFGLVAVEAMATGTPVIASRVGGLTFTVEDGVSGILVPNGDSAAMGKAIHDLLTDDDRREVMGEQAAISARRFSWPLVAEQIHHIYGQLAEGRRNNLCHEEDLFA